MNTILQELNRTAGIRGSMVMTQDGIVAASALGPGLAEDVVAALASSLLNTVKDSFVRIFPDEKLSEITLTATEGKLVFLDLNIAYLVVVAKKELELATTIVDIRSAAHQIRHRSAGRVRSKA